MSALNVLQVPNNDGVIPESPRQGRNGVAYDMVYKPASGQKPAESPRVPDPEKEKNRMKEAVDRRMSLESAKIDAVKARISKVDAAREKRVEEENLFKKETEEELERDINMANERREKLLNDLICRLRNRMDRVKKAQQSLTEKCRELEHEIGQKLTEAEEKRTQRINEVKERAQVHLTHVKEVMEQADMLTADSETKISDRMDTALKNREEQMNCMLQRLHEHSAKVEHLRRQRQAAAQGVPTPNVDAGSMEVDKTSYNGTPKR